jgi:hypothetical protein
MFSDIYMLNKTVHFVYDPKGQKYEVPHKVLGWWGGGGGVNGRRERKKGRKKGRKEEELRKRAGRGY